MLHQIVLFQTVGHGNGPTVFVFLRPSALAASWDAQVGGQGRIEQLLEEGLQFGLGDLGRPRVGIGVDQDAGEEGLVQQPPPGGLGLLVGLGAVGSEFVGGSQVVFDARPPDVGQIGSLLRVDQLGFDAVLPVLELFLGE